MRFEVHRQNSANLKFFLNWWGFKCVFGIINENFDSITVLPDEREDLLLDIVGALESTGHIPYHLSLAPHYKGKAVKGEKALFTGEIIQINEFQNVSGKFRLILFQDSDKNNWAWKSYGNKDLDMDKTYRVTGRIVCKLESMNKKNMTLFNYARLKEEDVTTKKSREEKIRGK